MSKPAEGTTFWVFIPTALAVQPAPRLQDPRADSIADRLFQQVVRIHAAN